jgi:acyl-CoA reductase-like NAD-dependent aldehyde dehydrogenase
MANVRFARTVREHLEDAEAKGATSLIARQNFPADDGRGAYVMPQVLINVDHTMAAMKDETFGPIVGIMPVRDDDEALALMNDSPYGLTASLWTADPDRALNLGRRVATGTLFLNRADYVDPAICWTGIKDTGRGGAMSALGYQAVTRPRSYHMRKVKP